MKILGLVLAGGQSSRFGSDKALALVDGKPLIEHALAGLAPFVDQLAVAGRDWPGTIRTDDVPQPGLGPLGGLLGGLTYAAENGFDVVLTSGCDTLGLTGAHIAALSPAPAILEALPVIGLWPSALAPFLAQWMTENSRHALYAFAAAAGARRAEVGNPPRNINRPEDLDG